MPAATKTSQLSKKAAHKAMKKNYPDVMGADPVTPQAPTPEKSAADRKAARSPKSKRSYAAAVTGKLSPKSHAFKKDAAANAAARSRSRFQAAPAAGGAKAGAGSKRAPSQRDPSTSSRSSGADVSGGAATRRPAKRLRARAWADAVEALSLANGVEEDAHRLAQRQKQIDIGKNTLAYDKFVAQCPRTRRKRGDPMTPLARQKCSKRSFNGQVTAWKKRFYAYVATMEDAQNRARRKKLGLPEEEDDGGEKGSDKGMEEDGSIVDPEDPAGEKVAAVGTEGLAEAAGSGADEKPASTEPSDDMEVDADWDDSDIELDDDGNVIGEPGEIEGM